MSSRSPWELENDVFELERQREEWMLGTTGGFYH